MKVLFALNNDNVSNAIIKKYQKQYKEIISYKNVYYFNAILKELQKDKTYDRVVISEDLEPFANNDYDTIDKFIFEKLDKISDEATNQNGDDIEIILICSDRVNKSDSILVKFFGIGIYNAIIGNDRQVEEVCKLIHQPRTKKEAKIYYKIESSNVNYQSESENSVNETEVQNILAHYKRLGKNEDKYVDSFNTIVAQYTDEQLKVIIKFLPLNVKAVLEEKSPKYQELVTFSSNDTRTINYNNYAKKATQKKEPIAVKMIEEESGKAKITKPIVIPNALKGKRVASERKEEQKVAQEPIEDNNVVTEDLDVNQLETPIEKRRRGRPKKKVEVEVIPVAEEENKKGRGRPKKRTEVDKIVPEEITIEKELLEEIDAEEVIEPFNIENEIEIPDIEEEESVDTKYEIEIPDIEIEKPMGIPEVTVEEPIDLFEIDKEEDNQDDEEEINLFELAKEDEEKTVEPVEEVIDLFNIEEAQDTSVTEGSYEDYQPKEPKKINNEITPKANNVQVTDNTNTLVTRDTKVVCFVGTTKNGTSFLVNNVAQMLSDMNISTAILDMTVSRNAYYIYTKNQENLRNIAIQSIKKLEQGIIQGIEVNKRLSVYTSLPGDNFEVNNIENIVSTLTKKHSVVLIDCDFDTPAKFFEIAHEIYLVQTQDVLTIQPLTAFLRNLKSKNILKQDKIKIVINKEQKVKGLTDKVLIGGMAFYNDPSMAFMTELFNKDNVMYCKIPFEMQNYLKYLSQLVDCSITLNGYTKQFINALNELVSMVYPLINKPKYSPIGNRKKNKEQLFSNEINNTLNKMKKHY